jgi:hypothetical protein
MVVGTLLLLLLFWYLTSFERQFPFAEVANFAYEPAIGPSRPYMKLYPTFGIIKDSIVVIGIENTQYEPHP